MSNSKFDSSLTPSLSNSTTHDRVLDMISDEIKDNLSVSAILLDYSLSGIDFSLAGNGGPDCASYISIQRRTYEAILALVCCAIAGLIGWKIHSPPRLCYANSTRSGQNEISHSPFRLFLLASLAMAYGLELGYKLTTRQLIFILNPCHFLCIIQLYFLACPGNQFSRKVNFLFRVHLSQLYLPIVAFVCPVTNTLFLPGEVFTYYLEHILLLAIPLYLIIFGGPSFKAEPFRDLGYSFFSYASFGVFNFAILQPLAEVSLANLNSILCPAIADPFAGPNYRLHALWHQLPQAIFGAKIYGSVAIVANVLLNRASFEFKKE